MKDYSHTHCPSSCETHSPTHTNTRKLSKKTRHWKHVRLLQEKLLSINRIKSEAKLNLKYCAFLLVCRWQTAFTFPSVSLHHCQTLKPLFEHREIAVYELLFNVELSQDPVNPKQSFNLHICHCSDLLDVIQYAVNMSVSKINMYFKIKYICI